MWISYVYRKDVHEPEPKRAVLIALTFGFLCTIPALILSLPFVIFFSGMFVATVIGAPLVEEFCKASGLPLVKSEMNAEMDGVIYGVTLGMGFAMVENFLYELEFIFTDPALWTFGSLLRGLGSTIGHGLGAGMIGYAYAAYIMDGKRPGALLNVVFAYIAAVSLHALWNGVAYLTGESILGLIVIILIAFAEVMILRALVSVARDKEMKRHILAASEHSFQVFKGGGEEKVQGGISTSQGTGNIGNPKGDFRCPSCQQAIEVPRDRLPTAFRCPICGALVNTH
ncbi:MAG: PrsW family intramembrane metalloprotease [Thermoplasmata archaeon]|nr:MAG: PrsW family intramembrane metalloprotease [Thermoplasmata archaeon]